MAAPFGTLFCHYRITPRRPSGFAVSLGKKTFKQTFATTEDARKFVRGQTIGQREYYRGLLVTDFVDRTDDGDRKDIFNLLRGADFSVGDADVSMKRILESIE